MESTTKKQLHTEDANKNGRASKMRLKLFYNNNKNEYHTIQERKFMSAAIENSSGENLANKDHLVQLKNRDLDFYTTKWTRLITNAEQTLDDETGEGEKKREFAWKLGGDGQQGSTLPPYQPVNENGEIIQYGYWTTYVSDQNGNFLDVSDQDENLLLNSEIIKRAICVRFKNPTYLPGIYIHFGNGGGYAKRFQLYYTKDTSDVQNPDIQLLEDVVLPKPQDKWEYSGEDLVDITQLWLLPLQWSEPYEPFRISQFSFFDAEMVLNDDDLYSVKVIESCEQDGDYESAGLNRLTVEINNTTKQLKTYEVKDLLISPEFTFCDVEMQNGVKCKKQGPEMEEDWVSLGTYYSNSWTFENRDNKITMEATDILDVISRDAGVQHSYFATGQESDASNLQITFATLAQQLKDATGRECGLKIQPEIGNRVMQAAQINTGDYKTILTELAVNAGGYLHVDRNNNITIWDYNLNKASANDFELTPENVLFNGETKSYADIGSVQLNGVEVAFGSSTKIYEGDITFENGQAPVQLDFTTKPAIVDEVQVDNQTLDAQYYDAYAECVLIKEIPENGNHSIAISGRPVTYSAAPVDVEIDEKGSQVVEFKELRFVQGESGLAAAQDAFQLKFQDTREKYEIECRGNPYIEIGDTVILTDKNHDQTAGFVSEAEYNYNGALSARYIIKSDGIKNIYGVQIDLDNPDPLLSVSYTDSAVGMEPGSDAWDNTSLFANIRPCVFKGGQVVYYLDRNNFTKKEDGTQAVLTGEDGDVMIEIPKIGMKIERDQNILKIQLTSNPNHPDFTYDAFTRDSAGDRDKLYVGAYLGQIANNTLNSVSDVVPTNQRVFTDFRNAARAKNTGTLTGYDILSWYPLHLLQCLYLIRYKTLNGQEALGHGYTELSGPLLANGQANGNGMYYGSDYNGDVMKFMGIESFWGMASIWIDGVRLVSKQVSVSPSAYIDLLKTAHKDFDEDSSYTEIDQMTTSGSTDAAYYLKNVIGSKDAPFIAREPQSGGSAATFFCDMSKVVKNCCCTFGGFSTSWDSAGPFNTYFRSPADTRSTTIGARLMYL